MTNLIQLRLPLVKEAATYVDVRDPNGVVRSFRFDRFPVQIDRAAGTVIVEMDEKAWTKRVGRSPEVVADRQKKAKKQTRKCLNCSHPFLADPAHRICPPCKKTSAWASGGDYALAG